MGVDPGFAGIQLEMSGAASVRPAFGLVEQLPADPKGAPVRIDGQVLDPYPPTQAHRLQIFVRSAEADQFAPERRNQDYGLIRPDGAAKRCCGAIRIPKRRARAWWRKQPFVQREDPIGVLGCRLSYEHIIGHSAISTTQLRTVGFRRRPRYLNKETS